MLSVREISENIEQETLAPWAAKSSQAVRDSEEAADDLRTAFQRDRDRIIHSTPFRKLKHKTQVYLCPGDHYRTRLTHSMEVSQIARTIARALRLNEDLTEAAGKDGGSAKWAIKDGTMVVVPGSGSIRTKEYFGDCQLHIEFKTPIPGKDNTLQMKGNSGIMLQSRYEVQVLDCEDNPTYVNGWVGSVYKQSAPLANAFTKTNEWQVYDIYWKAPRFGTNDELESPAMITVVLNGIVVQNNYVLKGNTPYTGLPKYVAHGRMPLSLQDHGVEVAFRNIWIRDL